MRGGDLRRRRLLGRLPRDEPRTGRRPAPRHEQLPLSCRAFTLRQPERACRLPSPVARCPSDRSSESQHLGRTQARRRRHRRRRMSVPSRAMHPSDARCSHRSSRPHSLEESGEAALARAIDSTCATTLAGTRGMMPAERRTRCSAQADRSFLSAAIEIPCRIRSPSRGLTASLGGATSRERCAHARGRAPPEKRRRVRPPIRRLLQARLAAEERASRPSSSKRRRSYARPWQRARPSRARRGLP